MDNKNEIKISLKLHIAPMQFNFLESEIEKKIYFEEKISDEERNKTIEEAREKVLDLCIKESMDCLEKINIPLDQKHLLSYINNQYQYTNKQEIKLDYTQLNNPNNKVESNKPAMIVPETIKPIKLDEQSGQSNESFQGLFSGLFNSKTKEEDPSDDIPQGIIEGSFDHKNG